MDRILIADLPLVCRIGVPEAERAVPQELRLDLELALDLLPAAAHDDVGRTADYAAVCALVRRTAVESERRLIETLAEDAARAVLAEFPAVAELRLRIRKPAALRDFGAAYAGVEIERRRHV